MITKRLPRKGKKALASQILKAVPHSASVKKEEDGKWKVDTSYIGHRTGDTDNLTSTLVCWLTYEVSNILLVLFVDNQEKYINNYTRLNTTVVTTVCMLNRQSTEESI